MKSHPIWMRINNYSNSSKALIGSKSESTKTSLLSVNRNYFLYILMLA
jgi:hypothetical protein